MVLAGFAFDGQFARTSITQPTPFPHQSPPHTHTAYKDKLLRVEAEAKDIIEKKNNPAPPAPAPAPTPAPKAAAPPAAAAAAAAQAAAPAAATAPAAAPAAAPAPKSN